MRVELTVNGRSIPIEVEPRRLLLDFLRDDLGLIGAKRSCDVQVCGTCTVLVDGAPVSACCYLVVDADEREVTTVEGILDTEVFARVEAELLSRAAVQCGFCTPGLAVTLAALLETRELTSRDGVRDWLSGNLCRCTGYKSIVDAVCALAGIEDTR